MHPFRTRLACKDPETARRHDYRNAKSAPRMGQVQDDVGAQANTNHGWPERRIVLMWPDPQGGNVLVHHAIFRKALDVSLGMNPTSECRKPFWKIANPGRCCTSRV